MAFDPDAFLGKYGSATAPAPAPTSPAGPSGPGGFDPDAFLGKFGSPAPAPTPPPAADPGLLVSTARGFKQGLSANFGDEIWGGLAAAFTPKTYKQARDEARASDKAAQEAHPIAYGAGEVGGSIAGAALLPEAGLVKGTGFAANAVRGAGQGALMGLGASDKEDVPGMIQDAAKGGLVGAATGGVLGTLGEKLVGGAPKRVDERLLQTITGGRATTAGKKIYQNEDLVLGAARKFGLDKVAKDPEAFASAAQAAQKSVGQEIGQAYEAADSAFLGVKVKDVAAAMRSTAAKYNSPVDAPIRKQIDTLVQQTAKDWGTGATKRVPLSKVNELVGKLEAIGFKAADVTPGSAKQLQRDLAKNVEGVLQRRLKEIQSFAADVKATPTAGASAPLAQSMTAADQLKRLTDLNKDYRGLKMITRMRTELAGVPPNNRAAGGLRDIAGKMVNAHLLFSNPLAYGAKKGAEAMGKTAVPAADEILRKISLAAQGGQTTAKLVQQALEAGVPRGAIAGALDVKESMK